MTNTATTIAIEDFSVHELLSISDDDDDVLSHQRNSKIFYPEDEKTMVEEAKRPPLDRKTCDKTLVETTAYHRPAIATIYEPLDQVNIRFSNDFSSLVEHFTALQNQYNDKNSINCQQKFPSQMTTALDCIRAESQLRSWMNRVKAKGVPKPMTEGYQPPPRPPVTIETIETATAASSTMSFNSENSVQTHASLSSSISVFLKKASSSAAMAATATLGRRTLFQHKTIATPGMKMGRLFFPPSMNRRSFSRPKVMPAGEVITDDSKGSPLKRPLRVMSPLSGSARLRRWRTASSPIVKPRPPTTPSSARIRSYKTSAASSFSPRPLMPMTARPHMLPESPMARIRPSRQQETMVPPSAVQIDSALNEICNNLPNMDRTELEMYLKEAGGDQMAAITLAMSHLKKKPEHIGYR
ncbi:hypothetical protein BX666DRAFT_1879729 [Dichotomocladium elegans]|nr:hypothetical protein BX666DRAFT_1879729 [Dichotomocladium elegans]